MEIIDYKTLVNELSDDAFAELKERLSEYYPFYFIDTPEKISKDLFLEKIGEYLRLFEMNHSKIRDKDLTDIYFAELFSLMKFRIAKASKAEEYYYKIEKEYNLLKSDCTDMNNHIEDITKFFLTFYDCFLSEKEKVSKISFFVDLIDYEQITEAFLKDKPESSDNMKRFASVVNNLTPKIIRDAADAVQGGFQQVTSEFNQLTKQLNKKNEKGYELIHSTIEEAEKGNHYSKRVYAFITLTLVYLRLKDFELGL